MVAFLCPMCEVWSGVGLWATADYHDDGSESLSCPACKAEIHETKLGRRGVQGERGSGADLPPPEGDGSEAQSK